MNVTTITDFVHNPHIGAEDIINTVYNTIPDLCKDYSKSKEENVEEYWKTIVL